MIGTNSAFASAGVVLAGQELVKDGDAGDGEGDGYGLRTAEEARARAYVEEELRRRRGELTDAEAGGSGAADAGAGGDDNRGAESWLTAIEEVDVAPELKIRNIEETERMKGGRVRYSQTDTHRSQGDEEAPAAERKRSREATIRHRFR